MMTIERLAQSETYYPVYQQQDSEVTAIAFGIRRISDGYWFDFNSSTFEASGWTTKHQPLAEDDDGLWSYDTGWAIPDSNNTYFVQFKITIPTETFYKEGPTLIVNSSLLDVLADWVNDGRLDLILDELTTQGDTNEAAISGLNDISVADIIAGIADGSYDLQEILRLMFAALCCKSSGGGTSSLKFRNSADGKDRITATVDSNGNRTAIILDAT